jgi:hypothetical protein
MLLPEDGDSAFPRGLAPLRMLAGNGAYYEPCSWMAHRL